MRIRVAKGSDLEEAMSTMDHVDGSYDLNSVEGPEVERAGKLLREIRRKAGLTQADLADMFDCSNANISRIERENTEKEVPEYMKENLASELAMREEWSTRYDHLLAEFERACKGKPTRRSIQEWIDKNRPQIRKDSIIYSEIQGDPMTSEKVYLMMIGQ